jgi:hypothetical protein
METYEPHLMIILPQILKYTIMTPESQIPFTKKYFRTNYGKFSIKTKGTDLWNKIPSQIKDFSSKIPFNSFSPQPSRVDPERSTGLKFNIFGSVQL